MGESARPEYVAVPDLADRVWWWTTERPAAFGSNGVVPMRMVQAIIAPERLAAVTALLAEAEIFRMTVSEVHGVSDMAGLSLAEVSPEPMVRIEVGVNEGFVAAAVAAIERSGGERGRIFTWKLDDVVRIRTGETGPDAI